MLDSFQSQYLPYYDNILKYMLHAAGKVITCYRSEWHSSQYILPVLVSKNEVTLSPLGVVDQPFYKWEKTSSIFSMLFTTLQLQSLRSIKINYVFCNDPFTSNLKKIFCIFWTIDLVWNIAIALEFSHPIEVLLQSGLDM